MALAEKVSRIIDEKREFNALASAERAAEEARTHRHVTPTNSTSAAADCDGELHHSEELHTPAGPLDSRTGLTVPGLSFR